MEIPSVAGYRFSRLRNNKERPQGQGPLVANEPLKCRVVGVDRDVGRRAVAPSKGRIRTPTSVHNKGGLDPPPRNAPSRT
jgi:hypothetical protein